MEGAVLCVEAHGDQREEGQHHGGLELHLTTRLEEGEPGEPGHEGHEGDEGEQGQVGDEGLEGEEGERGQEGQPGEPGHDGHEGDEGQEVSPHGVFHASFAAHFVERSEAKIVCCMLVSCFPPLTHILQRMPARRLSLQLCSAIVQCSFKNSGRPLNSILH
jgi:hypothetical protein